MKNDFFFKLAEMRPLMIAEGVAQHNLTTDVAFCFWISFSLKKLIFSKVFIDKFTHMLFLVRLQMGRRGKSYFAVVALQSPRFWEMNWRM